MRELSFILLHSFPTSCVSTVLCPVSLIPLMLASEPARTCWLSLTDTNLGACRCRGAFSGSHRCIILVTKTCPSVCSPSPLWTSLHSLPLSLGLHLSALSPPPPYLVIGTVLLLAFAALEEVSGGAACLGHLVLTDRLLGHGVPQFPQLITGHFLERNESAFQGWGVTGALPHT